MKKVTVFFLLIVFVFVQACQSLSIDQAGARISACSEIVLEIRRLQSAELPDHLLMTGEKRGGEFDVKQYFTALPHLSMREGYALDYVYQFDDLGGYPILYSHLVDQAPFASAADIPPNTPLLDFHNYLEVEDTEQGYFEYVVMDLMASQFYLYWHANYNDDLIVCNRQQVYDIVEQISSGESGYTVLNSAGQAQARTLRNIVPIVRLTGDVAIVEVVTFTKWGGFYRYTYTISRQVPHTILDVQQENLLPYDCGIVF